MNTPATTILKDALALPAAQRAAIVDELLHSLDKPDPVLDEVWTNEAEARIDAVERGDMEMLSAAEVFAKPAAP